MSKRKDHQIGVRISEDNLNQLKRASEIVGLDQSHLVRCALNQFLPQLIQAGAITLHVAGKSHHSLSMDEQIMMELRELRQELLTLKPKPENRPVRGSGLGILNTKQAAEVLRVNCDTIRRWARERSNRNHLPSIPNRRPLAFRAEIVEAHRQGKRGRELRELTAA